MDTLYFDNNATTPLDPRLLDSLRQPLANPASQHRLGRLSLKDLEASKTRLLQLLDAPASGMDTAQVFLTSGGTEANNLAILGCAASQPGTIITSSIEHPSILEATKHLAAICPARQLPVNSAGQVRLDILEQWLAQAQLANQPVSLVSVMLGNNETGLLQDLASIVDICHRYGALVHSDIIQAAGKIEFSMHKIGVDLISLTAHKLHGPVGIGALIARHGVSLSPILFGGGQQLEVRPGTEPVWLAQALARSLELAIEARTANVYREVQQWRDHFEELILAQLDDVEVVAQQAPRLPHTSNIAFKNVDRQALQMALDFAGIACSTGSACASGSGRPSHVLNAMGSSNQIISSSLRFSFSRFNSLEQIQHGADIVIHTVNKLRNSSRR